MCAVCVSLFFNKSKAITNDIPLYSTLANRGWPDAFRMWVYHWICLGASTYIWQDNELCAMSNPLMRQFFFLCYHHKRFWSYFELLHVKILSLTHTHPYIRLSLLSIVLLFINCIATKEYIVQYTEVSRISLPEWADWVEWAVDQLGVGQTSEKITEYLHE